MAKKVSKRREWTPAQVRTLKTLARKKTHAARIAKTLKRTVRCDAAKGIQYGFVARLAGLKFPPANPKAALWTPAPLSVGLFCEHPASAAMLLLGPTGVYSFACIKTEGCGALDQPAQRAIPI